MNQKVQDEICRENPYYESIKDRIILLTEDIYKELTSGPKLKALEKEVSIRMLLELLINPFGYSYVLRCAKGEIPNISISYIFYGDTMGTIYLNRTEFVRFVDEAIKNGLIIVTEEIQEHLESIRSLMTYELFKSKHGEEFNIEIDGNVYSIPSSLLFKMLEMSDDEFARVCSNQEITHIGGILKEHLIYATLKYFDNGCMDEYLFSASAQKRLFDLKSNTFIDIQSINKHREIADVNQPNVLVNEDLRKAIFIDMPEDLSKVEQAIYIYIKMCKILTYDEEFYALNQKVPSDNKNRLISYIGEISPNNNQVVCYEFNAIYAKLLEELGIKFTIDYKDVMEQAYGVSHANLEWRYHKFLVNADSTVTFLGNDMMQAKLNQPLQGLTCINLNKETKNEFKRLVSRVYRMIALKENKDAKGIEQVESLEDLLKEYLKCTKNIKDVSLDEKIDILFNKMSKESLRGIDLLAYILQLSKVLFNEEEQKDNVNVVIIRKNTNKGEIQVRPVAVLIINTRSIHEFPEENEYFIYDSECRLASIDIHDLQDRFDEDLLAYIDPHRDIEISGVEKRGMK